MINLKNISKIYENKDVGILNVSLKFPFSGLYIIEGPSGCGKTTLLNIIGGLINFNEGSYSFCNEEIHKMNDKK